MSNEPSKIKSLGPRIPTTLKSKPFQSLANCLIQPHLTSSSFCYNRVKVSALALLKMAMHAKSGGNIEVMGVMQGKVVGDTFIVIDAFALPVEGTETRVNAQAEAYEYMVDFLETCKVKTQTPSSFFLSLYYNSCLYSIFSTNNSS